MKMRPELWYHLPDNLMRTLADGCSLDYDSYESSSEEALHSVLVNPTYYSHNCKIVQEYYKSLSDETLREIIKGNVEGLERQVEELKEYLE